MAKFSGYIGYVEKVEREGRPGDFHESIEEKKARGDIVLNRMKYEDNGYGDENLALTNTFSVVADSYKLNNVAKMRYVKWKGVKWEILSFKIKNPRIIIKVGGVYA